MKGKKYRYLLFAGQGKAGGFNDLIGSYKTVKNAKTKLFNKKGAAWGQIVDTRTRKVVWEEGQVQTWKCMQGRELDE